MTGFAAEPTEPALDIDDLPPRSHTLSTDELSEIFGGCNDQGEACEKDDDCCFGLNCYGGKCKPWRGP